MRRIGTSRWRVRQRWGPHGRDECAAGARPHVAPVRQHQQPLLRRIKIMPEHPAVLCTAQRQSAARSRNTSISRRESEDEESPCAIPRRRSRLQGAPIPSPACPSSRQSRRPSSAPWRRAPHRRRGRTSHARPSGRSGSSAPSACQARRRDHPTCSCWQQRFASDWGGVESRASWPTLRAHPITRIRRPRGYGWRDVALTDRRDPCRCAPRTRRAIGGRALCRCIL